jgi:hypothetical protein
VEAEGNGSFLSNGHMGRVREQCFYCIQLACGRVVPVWPGLKFLVLRPAPTMLILVCGRPQGLKTSSYSHIGDTLNHARSSVDPSALLAICAATIEGIAGWVLKKSTLSSSIHIHSKFVYTI